jgi:hypothetical protein
LTPSTVERFVSRTVPGRTAATYRNELARAGRQLTRRAPWPSPPARMSRRAVTDPYADVEVTALLRDIGRQRTHSRRRAGLAVAVLGLAVGADGRWSPRVRGTHVVQGTDGVFVRLPEPHAREVPCLQRYEDELVALADAAGSELLVGGTTEKERNWVSHLQAKLQLAPRTPRLSASRCRSTWLVGHLNRGVRLPEIRAAAGLETVTVLNDLLPHVVPLARAEAVIQLRGLPPA